MAVTKSDFIQIGRRRGFSEEEATAYFDAYRDGRNQILNEFESEGDDALREAIDRMFFLIKTSGDLVASFSSQEEKKRGLLSKLFKR